MSNANAPSWMNYKQRTTTKPKNKNRIWLMSDDDLISCFVTTKQEASRTIRYYSLFIDLQSRVCVTNHPKRIRELINHSIKSIFSPYTRTTKNGSKRKCFKSYELYWTNRFRVSGYLSFNIYVWYLTESELHHITKISSKYYIRFYMIES